MNSDHNTPSRAQQQEKISRDPLKTPATDTASAQPHEIAEAARQQGRPAHASDTGAQARSQPARNNPNQPGSDAAALQGEHNAAQRGGDQAGHGDKAGQRDQR
jgi:hypothetical protein